MSNNKHIGIIGAGIVGLSSALWLQRLGYQVTLIDRDEPGVGTSYGNAGVFASFARIPYTKFSMLAQIPGMLIDKNSPLSLARHYLPNLVPYGWNYFKSCFQYQKGKAALTALQEHTFSADQILLDTCGAGELVKSEGSLGLFATDKNYLKAKRSDLRERAEQGVRLELLDAAEVRELEPDLEPFYVGGVYYPDTRFTVSPVELSRSYANHFLKHGGRFIREEVKFIDNRNQSIQIQTTLQKLECDQLVIAAGVASKELVSQLGLNIPLVSERGYHLTLNTANKKINRPVAWLDNAVFVAPMTDGLRLAGTAEFANPDAPPDQGRINCMLRHARTMLGEPFDIKSTWFGSRPSTPDSLPIIDNLPSDSRITLAFGHGHLGLTLSAITGKLVSEKVHGAKSLVDLEAFSATRFN